MIKPIVLRKGLSLDRLKTLRDVAEAGGIRNAVGDDPARQSLASRQLKELEECFDVTLTSRKGRTISLTPAGVELARISNDFFMTLAQYESKLKDERTELTIGIGDSVFQWYLLPCLAKILNPYPQMGLIPHSQSTAEIIQGVNSGELSLGVVRVSILPLGKGQPLVSVSIGTVRYRLFVPQGFVDSSLNKPKLEHLIQGVSFCSLSGGGQYRVFVDELLEKHGVGSIFRCASLLQVCGAVQSGNYAAVLPEEARQSFLPEQVCEFDFPALNSLDRELALIWRSRMIREGSAYADFANHLAETLIRFMKRM